MEAVDVVVSERLVSSEFSDCAYEIALCALINTSLIMFVAKIIIQRKLSKLYESVKSVNFYVIEFNVYCSVILNIIPNLTHF